MSQVSRCQGHMKCTYLSGAQTRTRHSKAIPCHFYLSVFKAGSMWRHLPVTTHTHTMSKVGCGACLAPTGRSRTSSL